jgi:uncharacterized membrane protein
MPLQLLGESSWRPRPKYLLFGLIGLMMLTVINRDRALLNPHAPTWEHYRYFRWWLLPHGIAGSLALFLGPLQFSNKLRRRFLPWHRIIGRTYVCGVAVAVPVGIWIEYIKYVHEIAPLRLLVATIGFGTLFVLTTGVAFFMVRRNNIQAHRRWMTRSYAVAVVFLEGRFVDQIPMLSKSWEGPSNFLETHHVSDLWAFIALSLTIAEIVIRGEQLIQRRLSTRKPIARAAGV